MEANSTSSYSETNIHNSVDGIVRIFYMLISTIGIVGNLVVIVVILNDRNLRKRRVDFLIVHQSVIDLAASLLIIGQIVRRKQNQEMYGAWDDFVCRVWLNSVTLWTCFMMSTYNLVLVATDRFCAVVFPILYRNTNVMTGPNLNWTLVCFGAVWTLVIGFNLMLTTWPTGIVNGICKSMINYPTEFLRKMSGVLAFLMQYAVPCVCFIICYVVIIRKLTSKAKDHRNIHVTLALVVVCCVTCNTLNQFLFLAFNFGYSINFSGVLYHISVLMVFMNCCINPIVYALKYDAFRISTRSLFYNMLGIKYRTNSPENSNQTSLSPAVNASLNQITVEISIDTMNS